MAADDAHNMEWLDYEDQMQDPKSDVDEGDPEYEFPEMGMGCNLSKSERESLIFQSLGRSIPDKVVSQ